jgi:hypothetical protein
MEEIGLTIIFEEIRNRNKTDFRCVVRAIEHGNGDCSVEETLETTSWEDLKNEYPTLEDILNYFFNTYNWSASWRGGDRMLFIESIEGHEGLYNFDPENPNSVSWDNDEEEDE